MVNIILATHRHDSIVIESNPNISTQYASMAADLDHSIVFKPFVADRFTKRGVLFHSPNVCASCKSASSLQMSSRRYRLRVRARYRDCGHSCVAD